MPVIADVTLYSSEMTALDAIRTLLAPIEQLQEVSEMTEKELKEKIQIGAVAEPLDRDQWSRDELADQFFLCAVASTEENGYQVLLPETQQECPIDGGEVEIYMRRHVRDIEVGELGRQVIWNWFNDRTSSTINSLMTASMNSPLVRLSQIERAVGPNYGAIGEEVGQGQFIWCSYHATWGLRDQLSTL